MIWNTIPNDERLYLWKKLRHDIENISIQNQLEEISKFCSTMPFGSRTLDYYNTENWPSPWEILYHGSFCISSISLLIFYTLILLPISIDLELFLVENSQDGIYLLPIIDNQYVLNYHIGQVSKYLDIQNDFKVLKKYSKDQIKSIT